MSGVTASSRNSTSPRIRRILLLLALITSPLLCCGCFYLLDILPASLLPSSVDFMVNLFEAQARVENRTTETLYITPFTTIHGRPVVITQPIFFRQRDVPLRPDHSIVLAYDLADAPISGIVVCRTDNDCRLLAGGVTNVYNLLSYENLPGLEQGWLSAIQSQPKYNLLLVLIPLLSLLPVALFSGWLYLGRQRQTH